MSAFADELAPALSSTLARVQAPPPPPPKGTFADGLAAAFGGGPDIQGAYGAGLEQRSKFNAQSAQTLSALAEADKRRTEAVRQEQINDVNRKAQADPNYVPSVADLLTWSTGAGDFTQGRLRDQEFANRATLTDPAAAPEAQFLAGQGVQGRVMPRIETAGGQNYNLATDPNMQAPTMTPLQQANVAAEVALAGQRDRSPAASSAGGLNIPSGFMADPANPGRLVPIPGGPKDPNYEEPPGTLGAREAAQYQRVITAAALAIPGIKNIMASPDSASMGTLAGVEGGKGVLGNVKASLARRMTSEDAKQYQSMWAGMNRALATIETSGMVPPGGLTASFDTLAFVPGDTHEVKLGKLAEMRQTVEYGLGALAMNPRIPAGLRADITNLVNQVKEAVPFTREDVIELTRARDPNTTLYDIIAAKGLGSGQPTAAPQGEPVRVTTVEEARALAPGTVFITPDGRRKVR